MGIWTLSRLHGAGLVEEAACLGCQEEEGTLHHRYFVSKATRDGRRTLGTKTWQHVAEQQPGSLLWTRALTRDPSREWPPLETKEEVHWRLAPGQEPLFEGSAFSDGSRCGNTEHAMVGWSVAGMEGMEPRWWPLDQYRRSSQSRGGLRGLNFLPSSSS